VGDVVKIRSVLSSGSRGRALRVAVLDPKASAVPGADARKF